ncbi:MAG: serine hydrolase [Crocinitomicaceae bacterium]|nr:serine hydrolase [Crocinitomicaceae bacterium]NGF76086.1 serine hydrolase [Fluviicola sp. SGL-29]
MNKRFKISLFLLVAAVIPLLLSFFHVRGKVNPAASWADEKLATLTLEQKIGQFFMVAAYPAKGDGHMNEIEKIIKENGVGSVIWFPVNKENYLKYAEKLQKTSSLPLLYGLDAEWGVSMRMENEDRFPYAYSVGAANDLKLSEELAEMMAYECAELGFQFNFSPVADVNSNPNNPVIGFRSFGDDSVQVGKQVAAFVRGFEKSGVYSSIKHFPGHGDTDVDSHYGLPTINKSLSELMNSDWIPFAEGIKAGATSVMVGHLNVPSLDPSGTPGSLSKIIIHDYLKGKLGFKGVVISDALNMKAVSEKYGKGEVAVKAFEAGCDILVYSENVGEAIQAIKKKVESGAITEKEINERCLKILKLKEKSFIKPVKGKAYTKGERDWACYRTFEKSTALLKNEKNQLPLGDLSKKILHISIGSVPEEFNSLSDEYAPITHTNYSFKEIESGAFKPKTEGYATIIVTVHATTVRPKDNVGMPGNLNAVFQQLPTTTNNTVVVFGNPLALSNNYDFSNIHSLIVAYENNRYVQNRVAQMIFGAVPFSGRLTTAAGTYFGKGAGLDTKTNGRLKFSQPEEVGVDPKKLEEIDRIVEKAIAEKAFPGCQIVAAVDGKLFFRKNYGTHQYNNRKVNNDDVYDIASITKVAASTTALMKLQSEGKFSLDKKLSEYLPDLTAGYPMGSLKLREMLAHQAGLKAWIPFYKYTLLDGNLNPAWYVKSATGSDYNKVADHIYLKSQYTDTIKKTILLQPLGTKKYLYSDLGYYFVKDIIEQESGKKLNIFLYDEVYAKMGLHRTLFNPNGIVDADKIVATEDDKIFRKQLIKGYVHDPGAAMIGGVGGHAGLFSNATELAALMQLFLNKGNYGGVQILDPKVVAEYTRVQFSGNRRGAGFDKPVLGTGGGTCDESASPESFGHSGFTGTLAWADPKNGLNYVFLSNRVYPDAENKKLISLGTRTEVQKVLNEALKTKK